MLPAISRLLLESLVGNEKPARIEVGIGETGDFSYSTGAAAGDAVLEAVV
jgi:hypothetical protein